MEASYPAPAWLVDRAREFAASGATPTTPRRAATVVLLRPAPGSFEVYALRRAATMAFAPSMYAFPGGSVDTRDASAEAAGAVAWHGPPPAWWAERLNLPEAEAAAVVCAAVRELFEECGVLLAGPVAGSDPADHGEALVDDVSGPAWQRAREALVRRDLGLAEFLASAGLAVRSDLLVPWDRWLTPEFEPYRFDAFFFVARMPQGQVARHDAEADEAQWLRPADALGLPMLPPTRHTFSLLARHSDIDEVLAEGAARSVRAPILTRLRTTPDGAHLVTVSTLA
ncbi:NUDIX hydrolase [Luedemannella helvata]|uniref:Nudix hydrolase domain-containing protein n=1 Tax=Luedemannella helvata TaxID=349315 RepID=A0ABP4WVZ7_9ACTN